MKIKEVKALAKVLEENGLSVIEVQDGSTTIRIEKSISQVRQDGFSYIPNTLEPIIENPLTPTVIGKTEGIVDFDKVSEFVAPIIGVFYEAPSPDKPAFAKKGDKVKKGAIICIIEAMKVLNEITSDRDGTIVDILVENGQVVEYGQVLFRIV